MKRFLLLFMVLGLIAGAAATAEAKKGQKATLVDGASEKDAAPSGTIVSGLSGLHHDVLIGCEMALDCRAWLASDCDPALSGRDPALSASIEDVGGLGAVSSSWTLEYARGAAAYARIQFWRDDCTEIKSARWGSRQCPACSLWMPPSARWMTVTGYTYNPWAVWPPIPHTSGPLTFNWALRQR